MDICKIVTMFKVAAGVDEFYQITAGPKCLSKCSNEHYGAQLQQL